jgi:hypothetical protein
MAITRAPGAAWSVEVRAGHETPLIEATANHLQLRSVNHDRFPFGTDQREQWQVVLPADNNINANLTVNAGTLDATLGNGSLSALNATYNAADGRLDLSGAGSTSFNATLNASSVALILPSSSFNANVTVNAATLNVCAAPELGLRITYDDTLSSNNFSAAGLAQSGKTWQSANYAAAAARAELHISANVSTTNLNPAGGCQ